MAPPFDKRSKTLGQDKRRTTKFDELDLAFADEHVESASTDPKIAAGLGNTHRKRLDVGLVFMARSLVVSGWCRHAGRSFQL